MREHLAEDARPQDALPPPPSCRRVGVARRAVMALALGGAVAALAAVVPASVAPPAAAVALKSGAKLPKGFPKSVPLPKGGTVLSSAETKLGEELGVNFAVKGSIPVVTRAYEHQLKAAGFKVTVGNISSSGAAIEATGHGWAVDATVESGKLFHLKAGESYIGIGVEKS